MQHGLLCWHLHRKGPGKKIPLPPSYFFHFHCLLADSVDPPFLWTLMLHVLAPCSGWQCFPGCLCCGEAGGWGKNGHSPEPGAVLGPARPVPSWVLSHCLHAQCSLLLSRGGSEITVSYFQYTQKPPCKTSVTCLHVQHYD